MGLCGHAWEAQREEKRDGREVREKLRVLRGGKSKLGGMDKWKVGSSKLTMSSMVFGVT